MQRIITILTIVLLSLIISANLLAADFQKGVEAADEGDYATAFKEWEPLAKQGDAYAQYNLGIMYYFGYGVEKDYSEAVKWYTLSAKQGHADAQYKLGGMYYFGYGVEKDYSEAVKWYTLSAKKGYTNAQYNLGIMYRLGQGVPKDYIMAYAWLNIAAVNGDKSSSDSRDRLEQEMTPSQIEQAQAKTKELMKTIKKQ